VELDGLEVFFVACKNQLTWNLDGTLLAREREREREREKSKYTFEYATLWNWTKGIKCSFESQLEPRFHHGPTPHGPKPHFTIWHAFIHRWTETRPNFTEVRTLVICTVQASSRLKESGSGVTYISKSLNYLFICLFIRHSPLKSSKKLGEKINWKIFYQYKRKFKILLIILNFFLWRIFAILWKVFEKKEYSVTNSLYSLR
jgi:hypothetical protein